MIEGMRAPLAFALALSCGVGLVSAGDERDAPRLIVQVRAVGREGAGAAEARQARDRLAAMGPQALVPLLQGMDTPNTVAANWLRTAFDEIVQRALREDRKSILVEDLTEFFLDPKRQGRARRLALGVLAELDAAAPAKLIPPLLNDPEFRYDAVQAAIAEGEQAERGDKKEAALTGYTKAFNHARHDGQLRSAAAKLRVLGRPVSIVEHLGYVVDWQLIGPFDGPEFRSFTTEYPPEKGVDLSAEYDGKNGKVRWQRYRSEDEFGVVQLAEEKALGPADDAAAYASAELQSPEDRAAEIRCAGDDNLTIWLNGEKVFAKEEWQNGIRFDRFVVPVRLRRGTNRLLVKICQGPAYTDPELSNVWSLQLRISDEQGRGVALQGQTE